MVYKSYLFAIDISIFYSCGILEWKTNKEILANCHFFLLLVSLVFRRFTKHEKNWRVPYTVTVIHFFHVFLFRLELFLKIVAMGFIQDRSSFLRCDDWNRFDLISVGSFWIDTVFEYSGIPVFFFSTLAAMRLFKLLLALRSLKVCILLKTEYHINENVQFYLWCFF